MTTEQLEKARKLWLEEKPQYSKYGESLEFELKEIFKQNKIPAAFSHRPKTDASLLKKMLIKDKPYNAINDKIGTRIVVHFLSDLNKSDEIIVEKFGKRIIKRESKAEEVDDKTFGYLSIHYDIQNIPLNDTPLIGELQLRTICQNAWSELSHVLSYKPDVELPKDISREVNSLSALMEIADNQFQKILDMINKLPQSNSTRILKTIEGFFYSHISAWYDSEMSHYFLQNVGDLYNKDEDIIELIENYLDLYKDDISKKSVERPDVIFFSQPEIVIILERLDKCKTKLEKYWGSKYPIDQLELIANVWGTSIF